MHADEDLSHPNHCIPETQHQDKGFEFHPQQHPIPVLERTAMLHCICHPRPRSRCPTKIEDVSRTRGLSRGESLLLCLPYWYIDFHIFAIEWIAEIECKDVKSCYTSSAV